MAKPLLLATDDSAYLAKEVSDKLGGEAELKSIDMKYFASGECRPKVPEAVNRSIYVFHAPVIRGAYNVDRFVTQAILIGGALRRSTSRCAVTLCAPHIPYERQDWQDEDGTPISSADILNAILSRYPSEPSLLTFDMHNPAIAGQINNRIYQLYASAVLLDRLRKDQGLDFDKDVVFVSPDTGATKRTRAVAKKYGNREIVIIDKRKPFPGAPSTVVSVVGAENVRRTCIMYDDMSDKSDTIVNGAEALKKAGADDIYACFASAVLSKDELGQRAEDKIKRSEIKRSYTTNAIWRGDAYEKENKDWLTVVSIGPLIAKAIDRIERGEFSSEFFT